MSRTESARGTAALTAVVVLVSAAGCLRDRGEDPEAPANGFPARPPVVPVRVQAAYDGDTVFLRVRFPASEGTRHEYLRRVDGVWRLEGGGFRDLAAAASGDAERGDTSRVSTGAEVQLSVLLDDPLAATRLRAFGELGCFGQCHERQTAMPNWRAFDGPKPMSVWDGVGKGDLWIWRAHRSAQAGFADDLSLTPAGVIPDAGAAPFSAVEIGTSGLPSFVFDPATAGGSFAFDYASILAGTAPVAFDDGTVPGVPDAISVGSALAMGWVPMDGQTVPAQLLSLPGGSRANVAAQASYTAPEWDVTLSRKLATGDATGDLALAAGKRYQIALALHRDDANRRDHHVSLPIALLLGTAGEGISAVALAGTNGTPSFSDESAFPVTDLALFLPGVTSFDFLVGALVDRGGNVRARDVVHGGAEEVASATKRCADCHSVSTGDPAPPYEDAGPLGELVLRRGGVYGPTPFFTETP